MFTVVCTTEICDGWVSIRRADNTSNRDNEPKVSERGKRQRKYSPEYQQGKGEKGRNPFSGSGTTNTRMRIHVLTEALYGEKPEGDEAKNRKPRDSQKERQEVRRIYFLAIRLRG